MPRKKEQIEDQENKQIKKEKTPRKSNKKNNILSEVIPNEEVLEDIVNQEILEDIINKEVLEDIPNEKVLEDIPEKVLKDIPEKVLEDIINEKVLEDIPEKVLEDIINEEILEDIINEEILEDIIDEESKKKSFSMDNDFYLKKDTLNDTLNNTLNDNLINDFNKKLDDSIKNFENAYPKNIKENKNYILEEDELKKILLSSNNSNNILTYNFELFNENIISYDLNNLRDIFNKFKEACLLIEIYDNKLSYIEKKGYESRNQSVIDLLNKVINYKGLPNVQFIIFTNDFIDNKELLKYPYLLTFCRNKSYNTNLFPNFNFNHWYEANISEYEDMYNKFNETAIEWNDKSELVFWSGANTNIIREKIYYNSKYRPNYFINMTNVDNNKYLPLDEIKKHKYLLNMDGHSYGGRLNYLFLSQSCVIILKKDNKDLNYEEFFYSKFTPNIDYIEILYNENEDINIILQKIDDNINNLDCYKIAMNGYNKALQIFNINNIYDYIYDLMQYLSNKNIINDSLKTNISYLPPLKNYFSKNRINIDNNQINFDYQGKDLKLRINNLNITFIENKVIISYNSDVLFDRRITFLKNEIKHRNYKISVKNSNLYIFINNLVIDKNIILPIDNFIMDSVDTLSENGGWLFSKTNVVIS